MPELLIHRTDMAAIDDLLEVLRLNVRIYHNARVCGDWQLNAAHPGIACFHMPTQGHCRMHVPGHGDWDLAEGDVVIFPEEIAHSLLPPEPLTGPQQHLPIHEAQGTPGTSLLCGEIRFQHPGAKHLLSMMPAVVVIPQHKAAHWLAPVTELIVQESLRESSDNESPVLNQLCELLVCYTLRCYTENQALQQGVFSLLSDKRLAPAIAAIHKAPQKNWQLQALAAEAAMSRTQFAQHFRQISGWTPMQYLTWWRMQLAYALLQQGEFVAVVAERVGYGSEASFNRAFKQAFDETPGKLRSLHKR